MTRRSRQLSPADPGARVDAGGTAWRLRALVAMGHDCTRLASALQVTPGLVRRVVHGQARTVTRIQHELTCQLFDAWWDKTPPLDTPAQRRACAAALRQAAAARWPAGAGLDDDQLDTPGYQPSCWYLPAAGTGTAPGFTPPQRRTRRHHGKEIA